MHTQPTIRIVLFSTFLGALLGAGVALASVAPRESAVAHTGTLVASTPVMVPASEQAPLATPVPSELFAARGSSTRSPGELRTGSVDEPAASAQSPAVERIPLLALPQPAPAEQEQPSPWLSRQLNPGQWMLDAGLGIFAAALNIVNDSLRVGVLHVFGDMRLDCVNSTNLVFCTPKAVFLEASAGPSVGGIVRLAWGVLRPLALSLITLLFVVRIGRLIAEGPNSLAAEGRQLALSLTTALVATLSIEHILGLLFDLQNALHNELLRNANLGSVQSLMGQPVSLNPGVGFATLVLLITMAGLVVRAVTRALHLTLLLAVAPLMGALLMDSSTSARFGAWFTRLLEVLLRQTAWVFVFWVGMHLFHVETGQTNPADQIVSVLLFTIVMLSALMGDSVLNSVIGAGGGSMTARIGGMLRPMALMHLARRQIVRAAATLPPREHTAGNAIADPARSPAARRASLPTVSKDPAKIDKINRIFSVDER